MYKHEIWYDGLAKSLIKKQNGKKYIITNKYSCILCDYKCTNVKIIKLHIKKDHKLPKISPKISPKFIKENNIYESLCEKINDLKKNATESEKTIKFILYTEFKNENFIFQKGFIIGKYSFIADFYFPDYSLIIEIDGKYHNTKERRRYDKWRDSLFKQERSIKTLRFTNNQVKIRPHKVIETIKKKLIKLY